MGHQSYTPAQGMFMYLKCKVHLGLQEKQYIVYKHNRVCDALSHCSELVHVYTYTSLLPISAYLVHY